MNNYFYNDYELIKKLKVTKRFRINGKALKRILSEPSSQHIGYSSYVKSVEYYKDGLLYCIYYRPDMHNHQRVIPYEIKLIRMDSFNHITHLKKLKRVEHTDYQDSKYEVVNDKLFILLDEEIYNYQNNVLLTMEKWNGYKLVKTIEPEKKTYRDGNYIHVVYPDSKNHIITQLNSNDKPIETIQYSERMFLPKKELCRTQYTYDTYGNLVSEKHIEDGNKISSHYKYEYQNNNKTKFIDLINDRFEVYEYLENKIIYKHYSSANTLYSRTENTFHSNGLLAESITTKVNGEIFPWEILSYTYEQ